MITLKTNIC